MEEALKKLSESLGELVENMKSLLREAFVIVNIDFEIKRYCNRLKPSKEIKPRAVPFVYRKIAMKCRSNC
ncbi:MAG: hypothetical protein ACLR02_15385 [Clostridium sp.]